ncbi:MAG: GFA family protein [Pseudomonadales bacterium]|nr:GFA family protein [Pseudomonadales bacterium]
MINSHCKNCSTTVWRSSADMPGILGISAGTFRDNQWFKPAAHIWTGSAQSWVSFQGEAVQFKGQATPEQLLALSS